MGHANEHKKLKVKKVRVLIFFLAIMLLSFTELFTFMWLLYTAWKWPVFRILLVSIFLHSDWIERDTLISLRIQSKYGKIGTKKLRIRTLHAVMLMFKSLFHPFLPDGNMKRYFEKLAWTFSCHAFYWRS